LPIDYKTARDALVRSLRREIRDERVLDAFARVPRERFVAPELRPYAYDDRALPIGHDQTISQPLMVAIMTQALRLRGGERVLEVGTGSGYQAAILSLLAREVVTVERVRPLAERAARLLRELGCANVRVFLAGETLGWPVEAPYDAIVVTAGAAEVPQALVDQLAPEGRLVVPAGGRRLQQLVRVTKSDRGVTVEQLGECGFVPLISHQGGWPEPEPPKNGAKAE
jgi:protein-L-isoaspartate(D-aspartate) O-methyltransferase